MLFKNRRDAGKKLAVRLGEYKDSKVAVYGLPRGGVPVAYEVARFLGVEMDVIPVRKIGLPGNREMAIGAVGPNGSEYLDRLYASAMKVPKYFIEKSAKEELIEIARQEKEYREGKGKRNIKGKIVILVDDGIATGATVKAAIRYSRRYGPREIIVAVPVCSKSVLLELRMLAESVVCFLTPEEFSSVGYFYKDFGQVGDDEVKRILRKGKSFGND